MAQQRVCDIYGTAKDVAEYRILVTRVDPATESPLLDQHIDLSQRGAARLLHFLERALRPPSKKND